jgi:predicted MFS family arabinose efflux permease
MGVLPFVEFVPAGWQPAWPMATQVGLTIGWSMFNVNLVPALMAVTADGNRSAAYALSSTLRSVGTFVGTLVGGLLPGLFAGLLSTTTESPTPYSGALWVGAVLGLAAMIPLNLIRGGDAAPRATAQAGRRGRFPLLPVALMVLYVYLRHAGWTSCQAFCNPYMDEGLQLSTSTIGLLTSVGQVASIAASLAIPALADRLTHGGLLIAVTLGLSGSLGLLAAVPHWLAVGAGLLGVLVFTAMWLPTLQIFQMETIDESWRSLAYGAVSMAMGLGFGSMSYVGGRFIETRGYRPLFLIGVALTGASSLLLAAILRARQAH